MGGDYFKSATNPVTLISRKTGNWWQDYRRNWCAYCGISIDFNTKKPGHPKATKDHVIPKSHKGRHVTIPCCAHCNSQKGMASLPEFMLTDYFNKIRSEDRPHKWPLSNLWLVLAWAAVEQARDHMTEELPKAFPKDVALPV